MEHEINGERIYNFEWSTLAPLSSHYLYLSFEYFCIIETLIFSMDK